MSESEIRQSQLLTTFGPGSLVDLPNDAVMIGGLEHWVGEKRRVNEERLEGRIAEMMGVAQMPLYAPPVDSPDPTAPETGVRAFLFPLGSWGRSRKATEQRRAASIERGRWCATTGSCRADTRRRTASRPRWCLSGSFRRARTGTSRT